jgi:hypothetical protein
MSYGLVDMAGLAKHGTCKDACTSKCQGIAARQALF